MAVRPIDANELLGIERLLDTDVVRQSKTASWLLNQVLHDIQAMPTLTPQNEPERAGLYGKYTVYKNKDGSLVTDCFVLRPAKDPAAVAALRAYATATDNAELSADIINWVGAEPSEWVSVEERLPDELTMVLIYSGGIYDVAGWIEDEDGKICWTHNAKPQFWRPIPGLEPPGKDNNVPTKEQNEPLTLDELREMDGEPVWVVPTGTHKKDEPMWCVLEGSMALIPGVDCWLWDFDGYGETWMAYRRPPEGEA